MDYPSLLTNLPPPPPVLTPPAPAPTLILEDNPPFPFRFSPCNAIHLAILICTSPILVLLFILSLFEKLSHIGNQDLFKQYLWRYLWHFSSSFLGLIPILLPTTLGSCIWRFPISRKLISKKSKLGLRTEARYCMTFDDAPGDCLEEFEELLDVLKKFNVKSTFFVTSSFITDANAVSLRRAVSEGHELANHMPEDRSYFFYGKEEFRAALKKAEGALVEVRAKNGSLPRLFRPPNGQMSRVMGKVLKEEGYTSVMTDCWSNDPMVAGDSTNALCEGAVKYHVKFNLDWIKDGSVAVFHVPGRDRRKQVVEVMRRLLGELERRGMKGVTVGGMMIKMKKEKEKD
ncbi:hypothetical protein ScalyP_jg32 [Parmales sp. scaly parma]|nr:hypothetical protein ScalyP_jg32 [Parmales sp. scaly parma]